jgi:hypothetical protein
MDPVYDTCTLVWPNSSTRSSYIRLVEYDQFKIKMYFHVILVVQRVDRRRTKLQLF